jgi:hypothetical protein
MSKLTYTGRLLGQFVQFARRNKVYWIVPLVILLGLFAALGGTVQSAGTLLIYTLF